MSRNQENSKPSKKVIVVGASTGGNDALPAFLKGFKPGCPGIVIVQHMPPGFTQAFADRLNEECEIEVEEARFGEIICDGKAIIAPGSQHIVVKQPTNREGYSVRMTQEPADTVHRPSVDVLFDSVAHLPGKDFIGVLLTGMGADGAKGLLKMKEAGAYTIAQNKETCLVFGMPKKAIELGAAEKILPLEKIAEYISKNL